MGLKLGRKLSSKRCKWCRSWEIYECGNPHRGVFGSLTCRQCRNKGSLCAGGRHPRDKHPSDY